MLGPQIRNRPITMPQLARPSQEDLKRWLETLDIDFYLCGACDGYHLAHLQQCQGVFDSKLELMEPQGLLAFSTSVELRPTALLTLHSQMNELSQQFTELKLYIDVVDDTLPKLIISCHCLIGAGLTEAQFTEFLGHHQGQTLALLKWIEEKQYAMTDEIQSEISDDAEEGSELIFEMADQHLLH